MNNNKYTIDIEKALSYTENVRSFLFEKYKNKLNINELESILNFTLYKAVKSYNPAKNYQLSTYYKTCAVNDILRAIRVESKHMGKHVSYRTKKETHTTVELDKIRYIDERGNEVTLADTLIAKDDIEKDVELDIAIKTFKNFAYNKNTTERKVLQLMLKGYAQKEVKDKLNISQPYTSKLKKKALLDFKKIYPDYYEILKNI